MQVKTTLAPGLEISKIITGLWQIADMEKDGETLDPHQTAPYMRAYFEQDFTTFDMADHYGSSEIIAGTFKQGLSDKSSVQLFTKWVPKPAKISREDVRAAVQKALDRMQVTSIDLLQFHAWHYPDPSWLDGLFYLKELKDEGLIRHLGVTNFDAAHLRIALASGIPIVSNQVCHSLIDTRASQHMAAVCQKYNVKLLAFGTLAGGFLTERWLGQPEPSYDQLTTWSQMKYKRFIDAAGGWAPYQNLLQTVKYIAEKHNVSVANISSCYILENPAVAAVIIGARLGESEHITDNKHMVKIVLDQADISAIKKAQDQLQLIPGGCGDEYQAKVLWWWIMCILLAVLAFDELFMIHENIGYFFDTNGTLVFVFYGISLGALLAFDLNATFRKDTLSLLVLFSFFAILSQGADYFYGEGVVVIMGRDISYEQFAESFGALCLSCAIATIAIRQLSNDKFNVNTAC